MLKRSYRYIQPVPILIILMGLVFGAGLALFNESIAKLAPPDPLPKADGIIVLTGGVARIDAGLALLKQQKGARLLISGVNPMTTKADVVRTAIVDSQLADCCIDLGHEAKNTIGNADESAAWISQHHFKTVYIVTNDYHMPRAIRELRKKISDVVFIAYPVRSNKPHQSNVLKDYDRLYVIGVEYLKYIAVWLKNRLT